jgi:UDP-N-acetylmuramate dehydrogenase
MVMFAPALPTIQSSVVLAPFTAYQVGGCAQWFIQPKSIQELQSALVWAKENDLPITWLGFGSNVLVSDQGIRGLVVCLRSLQHIEVEGDFVRVAAGVSLAKLAIKTARLGLGGMEWAVGIPGSVGGGVVMNCGAHGQDMSESVVSLQVMTSEGDVETWTAEDLKYSYRTSSLQSKVDHVVLEATLHLSGGQDPKVCEAHVERCNHYRKTTQPAGFPTCGSVFRNPKPHGAGWLIEHTGLKGTRIGGVEVSELHANFFLNREGATAQDIIDLMKYVQERVWVRWQVLLQPEVKLLGEFTDMKNLWLAES